MSYAKGFTYENIQESCKKYNCELITTEDDLDSDTKIFTIKSCCGHETETSFCKFMKDKKGIYCDECVEDLQVTGAICFGCRTNFIPVKSLCYCSKKCSLRRVTEEQKTKTRNTLLNKNDDYKDANGNLKSEDEIKAIGKDNRNACCRERRRKKSNKPIKIKAPKLEKEPERHKKYTYDDVKEIYKKYDSTLLTTKNEFDEMISTKTPSHSKYKVTAKCGHDVISSLANLLYFKCELLCDACTKQNISINARKNGKIDNIATTIITEGNGIDVIKNSLPDFFVQVTQETCFADILVKPKLVSDDIWLPIQLKISKSPTKKSGQYSFSVNKHYNKMLLLLLCLEDNKIWLFNDKENYNAGTVCIGKTKSKFDSNVVKLNDLQNELNGWYIKNCYNITEKEGNVPTSECVVIERTYADLRTNKVNFLKFVRPEYNNIVYDFLIEGKKFQEKVCLVSRHGTNWAYVVKNGGYKLNKQGIQKPTQSSYSKGDNDFYWIHERSTTFFLRNTRNYVFMARFYKNRFAGWQESIKCQGK